MSLWTSFFRNLRIRRSSRKPVTAPRAALVPRIFRMVPRFTASEIKMGSISSEVDRKTAIRVPAVIRPPEYRLEAAAENPHWGTAPRAAPARGPKRPVRRTARAERSPARCSRYSITRYVKNRKGSSLAVSSRACSRQSVNSMWVILSCWFLFRRNGRRW